MSRKYGLGVFKHICWNAFTTEEKVTSKKALIALLGLIKRTKHPSVGGDKNIFVVIVHMSQGQHCVRVQLAKHNAYFLAQMPKQP